MTPTFPTEPTAVILADGKERHLRYSLAAVKAIKKTWGPTPRDILTRPPEEVLPAVIFAGLVEKEDLTEADLANLITGESADYVSFCFIQAFFGLAARRAMESVWENQAVILAKLAAPKQTPEPPTPEIVQ